MTGTGRNAVALGMPRQTPNQPAAAGKRDGPWKNSPLDQPALPPLIYPTFSAQTRGSFFGKRKIPGKSPLRLKETFREAGYSANRAPTTPGRIKPLRRPPPIAAVPGKIHRSRIPDSTATPKAIPRRPGLSPAGSAPKPGAAPPQPTARKKFSRLVRPPARPAALPPLIYPTFQAQTRGSFFGKTQNTR